MFDTLL